MCGPPSAACCAIPSAIPLISLETTRQDSDAGPLETYFQGARAGGDPLFAPAKGDSECLRKRCMPPDIV